VVCPNYSSPLTFRYFNYWADCAGFEQLLRDIWSTQVNGYMQYQVMVKLKTLKNTIKHWKEHEGISTKNKVSDIRRQLGDIHVHSMLT